MKLKTTEQQIECLEKWNIRKIFWLLLLSVFLIILFKAVVDNSERMNTNTRYLHEDYPNFMMDRIFSQFGVGECVEWKWKKSYIGFGGLEQLVSFCEKDCEGNVRPFDCLDNCVIEFTDYNKVCTRWIETAVLVREVDK